MTKITMTIKDAEGNVKQGKNEYEEIFRPMEATMEDCCHLATSELTLEDGDVIEISLDQENQYLIVKLDETLDRSLVFIPNKKMSFQVTLSENAKTSQSDLTFMGKKHYLEARVAYEFEISNYQNLSVNTHDQKNFTGAYPHAFANVETRDEAVFFAENAIDGVLATKQHGPYPYESWGINRQADAALTIDFGRKVEVDQVAFTLRADYPHDSYWEEVTLEFSDGSAEIFKTTNSDRPQFFKFPKREISTVTFTHLKKATDESPFPALTQIALFGQNK